MTFGAFLPLVSQVDGPVGVRCSTIGSKPGQVRKVRRGHVSTYAEKCRLTRYPLALWPLGKADSYCHHKKVLNELASIAVTARLEANKSATLRA